MQGNAYKILNHLVKSEKDTENIDIIPEIQWIKHYNKLWYYKKVEEKTKDIKVAYRRSVEQNNQHKSYRYR